MRAGLLPFGSGGASQERRAGGPWERWKAFDGAQPSLSAVRVAFGIGSEDPNQEASTVLLRGGLGHAVAHAGDAQDTHATLGLDHARVLQRYGAVAAAPQGLAERKQPRSSCVPKSSTVSPSIPGPPWFSSTRSKARKRVVMAVIWSNRAGIGRYLFYLYCIAGRAMETAVRRAALPRRRSRGVVRPLRLDLGRNSSLARWSSGLDPYGARPQIALFDPLTPSFRWGRL